MIIFRNELKADAGKKLCDRNGKVIGSTVLLGKEDTADRWEEITEEEADSLQMQWENEAMQDILEPGDIQQPDEIESLRIENADLRKQVAALEEKLELQNGGSVKPGGDIPFDPVPGKPVRPTPGGGLTIGG